jgi:hypothetical protein
LGKVFRREKVDGLKWMLLLKSLLDERMKMALSRLRKRRKEEREEEKATKKRCGCVISMGHCGVTGLGVAQENHLARRKIRPIRTREGS